VVCIPKILSLIRKYITSFISELKGDKKNKERPMISYIKENYSKNNLKGVEIGVRDGGNALSIMKTLDINKLILVDPYEQYTENEKNWDSEKQKKYYNEAKKNLKDFKDKIYFVKKKSEEAAPIIDDELDFVYIDGGHDFENVKKDIEKWFPKVKKGGIIGGHDFKSKYLGLTKAVNQFVEKNGYNLMGDDTDWWIIK